MLSSVKTLIRTFGLIGLLLTSPTATAVTQRQLQPSPSDPHTSNPYNLQDYYQAPFAIPEGEIAEPEFFLDRARPGDYQVWLVPRYNLEDHSAFVGEDDLASHMIGDGLNVEDVFWMYSVMDVDAELLEKIRSDRGVYRIWWLMDGGSLYSEGDDFR